FSPMKRWSQQSIGTRMATSTCWRALPTAISAGSNAHSSSMDMNRLNCCDSKRDDAFGRVASAQEAHRISKARTPWKRVMRSGSHSSPPESGGLGYFPRPTLAHTWRQAAPEEADIRHYL